MLHNQIVILYHQTADISHQNVNLSMCWQYSFSSLLSLCLCSSTLLRLSSSSRTTLSSSLQSISHQFMLIETRMLYNCTFWIEDSRCQLIITIIKDSCFMLLPWQHFLYFLFHVILSRNTFLQINSFDRKESKQHTMMMMGMLMINGYEWSKQMDECSKKWRDQWPAWSWYLCTTTH